MCGLRVVNKAGKGSNGAWYIGRAGRGVEGSTLANPRRVGDVRPRIDPDPSGKEATWTAGATIPFYRREFFAAINTQVKVAYWGYNRDGSRRALSEPQRAAMRAELEAMYEQWQRTGTLELDCYCKGKPGRDPDAPCHGDVLVEGLQLLHAMKQRRTAAQVPA